MIGTVVAQKFENIATWMAPKQSTDLPDVLKGVFFMDGNPLPDDCITMYNLDWDEQQNRLTLPVTAPAQWTFHRNLFGLLLLRGAQLAGFRYNIQFEDATLKNAQIIPIAFGIPVPRWLVDATMCQHAGTSNGELWDRKNIWLGGVPRVGEYVLRRIVDENGQYTPAFQDMLNKVDTECLVVQ